MANTTIREIVDKLYDVVSEISGPGQPLQTVYKRLRAASQQFPYACVDIFEESTSVRFDTSSNENVYSFIIRVVLLDQNSQDDADLRVDIADAVVDKLNSSNVVDTLGGTVCRLDYRGPLPYYEPSLFEQPVMGFDIIVSAGILKPIT